MEPNKIMHADLLDILFEGKNKSYGAYELRKTYNRRIYLAMISMGVVCLLFFLSRILANDNGKERGKVYVKDYFLKKITETKNLPEPPRPKPLKATPPQVMMKRFTPPVITSDKDVKELPPAIETLDNAQIGLSNQDGINDIGFVAPPVEKSTSVVEGPKSEKEEYEVLFTRVEKEAKFPGGLEAWKRYLERNLNASIAADDGAPTGSYTVKVQFVVDKEGGISNVQAIEVPKACPSCEAEAVKIIKRGPKWEPAIQNGQKVNYQAVQYVTFAVAEE